MNRRSGSLPRRPPILLIEDDEDLVSSLRALLEEEGYPVLTAADGPSAMDACDCEPALVFLDLHLPGPLSGDALVEALRDRLGPSVHILLLTGERDVVEVAERMGVDGFLEKPFEIDHLLRTIGSHTRH